MKNLRIAKALGALMLGGALAVGGVASVSAAENKAGVVEFMDKTVKSVEEALAEAKGGNEKGCLASIKQAKQYYKEITGDAAGKPLQDAIKQLKLAQAECEKEGGGPQAAAILTDVVAALKKVQSGVK
jgi:hypothetical protein